MKLLGLKIFFLLFLILFLFFLLNRKTANAQYGMCGDGNCDPWEDCSCSDCSSIPECGGGGFPDNCGQGTCPDGSVWYTICNPSCSAVPRSCYNTPSCNQGAGCTSDQWCVENTEGPRCGDAGNPGCGAVKCDIPSGGCYSDCSACPPPLTPQPPPPTYPPPPLPTAGPCTGPLNPSATCLTANQVRLNWDDFPGAPNYSIRVTDGNDAQDRASVLPVDQANCGPQDVCLDGLPTASTLDIGVTPAVGYSWRVVQNKPGCGSPSTSGPPFNCSSCVNKKPTAAPTITSVTDLDDGSIIQTRNIKIEWDFYPLTQNEWGQNCPENDNHFSLLIRRGSNTYHNISYISAGADVCSGASGQNCVYTTSSLTRLINSMPNSIDAAGLPIPPYTPYTATVCAHNGYQGECTSTTFDKQAYPTATITGLVGEYDSSSTDMCTTDGAYSNISFNFTAPNMTGISSPCTSTTTGGTPLEPLKTTSYSCNLSFDNVLNDPDPEQTFTLATSSTGGGLYSGLYCKRSTTPSCSSNPATSICVEAYDFDANGGGTTINTDKQAYLNIGAGASYYKVKNTTLRNLAGGYPMTSSFPVGILPFSDGDSHDYLVAGQADKYIVLGQSDTSYDGVGTVIARGAISSGYATDVSRKGWKKENYGMVNVPFTFEKFLEYVKSRKASKTITNLSQIDPEKINIWYGDLTLQSGGGASGINNLNNINAVIMVTETLAFAELGPTKGQEGGEIFAPTGASIALFAKTLNFSGGGRFVESANGIFMANTINLGSTAIPLKITGNLVSTQGGIATATRFRTDGRRPSLFVVFDPKLYMDLLPYISIAKYEWKMLQ